MYVAVLGSGLSGLTAAALLAKRGHRVSLYEQHPEIGGVTSAIEKNEASSRMDSTDELPQCLQGPE
jgi:phytoene dehydrogenase-like protein